jgi:hypothetical protein
VIMVGTGNFNYGMFTLHLQQLTAMPPVGWDLGGGFFAFSGRIPVCAQYSETTLKRGKSYQDYPFLDQSPLPQITG